MLLSLTVVATTTFNNPSSNAYINASVILNVTVSGFTPTTVTFSNSTDDAAYTTACTASLVNGYYSCNWNSGLYNSQSVIIKVVATDGGTNTDTVKVSGITVDNTPPTFSDFKNTSLGEHSAIILWNTSENFLSSGSNTTVIFNTSAAVLSNFSYNTTQSSIHVLNLSNLLEGVIYYWNATSCDLAGNCNTSTTAQGAPFSFTTVNIAPYISSVTATRINDTGALINWTTHELANSTVRYGTSALALNSIAVNTSNVTSTRWINITGLSPGVIYFYNTTSCDAAGNCNNTGTFNFTTLVDAAPPIITNVLLNGSTTRSYNQNDIANISASVTDSSTISSVWANLTKEDGSSSLVTLSAIAGSLYGALTTISGGNYTMYVYASDNYSDTGNSSLSNFTAFGTFTLSPSIASTFKNYTFGITNKFNITLFNENSTAESYTLSNTSVNNSGCAGWGINLNQSTLSSIPSFKSALFELILTAPMCAGSSFAVTVQAISSGGTNITKTITFTSPSISISIPSLSTINNVTYFLNGTTKYLSIGPITFSEDVDSISTNDTRVTCGIYTNGSNPNSVVTAGAWNFTNSSCLIVATSTPGAGYSFLALINDTRNHSSYASAYLSVPSAINISLSQPNATSNGPFSVRGTAVYASGYYVPYGIVNASFGNNSCQGFVIAGSFDYICNAPSANGNYLMTVYVTGVWNITSSNTTNLRVGPPIIAGASENLSLAFSSDSIIVEKGSNATFAITLSNKLTTGKTFSLNVSETGVTRRLQILSYNNSLFIPGSKSATINVVVAAGDLVKSGTSTILVNVTGEGVSGTLTANVSAKLAKDELNIDRYVINSSLSTTFGINITNTKKLVVVFNITEDIAKTIASTVGDIVFSVKPNATINNDPVVLWQLTLKPGDSTVIEYTVSKVVANPTFTAPKIVLVDFYLPSGVQQPGEVVQTTTVTSDIRPLLIFVIFLITAVIGGIILFKGEWLGFKERPSLSFLKKKVEIPKIESFKSELEKAADKVEKKSDNTYDFDFENKPERKL